MADLNRVKKVSGPIQAAAVCMCYVMCRCALLQELKECGKDSVVKVSLVSDADLLHWKGHIKGPEGTPYEGGEFCIDINLPADYPFVPPKVIHYHHHPVWCNAVRCSPARSTCR